MCATEVRRARNPPELLRWLAEYDDWLFDLDNTLFDQITYDACVFADIEGYLSSEGLAVEGLANTLVQQKVDYGPLDNRLFDRVLAQYGVEASWVALVVQHYRDARPLFTTDQSLVTTLQDRLDGHRLFIVTNGHPGLQAHKVISLGLDRIATQVVYCDIHEPETLKPSLWAWQQLTIQQPLHRPVFVGDSWKTDASFAANAGVDFIHFRYSV